MRAERRVGGELLRTAAGATRRWPTALPVTLRQDTRYPLDGTVKIQLQMKEPREFTLRSADSRLVRQDNRPCVVGELRRRRRQPIQTRRMPAPLPTTFDDRRSASRPDGAARAGQLLMLRRRWTSGDVIELQFDMSLRYEPGGGEMAAA